MKREITLYYGEAHTAIDEKGRITVPMQFRSVMEALDQEIWYMTRGFDGAIFLFHKTQWDELIDKGRGSSPLDPQLLDFRRFFIGGAAKAKLDRQGRMNVPGYLREYAGIEREGVLIGVEDHLEMWSESGWRAYQERQADQYKAMAAALFGSRNSVSATTEGEVRDA